MADDIKSEWFYVVVQNPDTDTEEFLGFEDQETGTHFIPAFETKEEAQGCFLLMPKDVIHKKYEVQALIKEDLILHAERHNFDVYLMDQKGKIKKKLEA